MLRDSGNSHRPYETHGSYGVRGCSFLGRLAGVRRPLITVPAVVVVAHPDDEVIGIGAQLGRLEEVRVVHVTDGSPRDLADAQRAGFASAEDYAKARRLESLRALELAGVPEARALQLGVRDQEAALALVRMTEELAQLFERNRPSVVFTHPYEGGHPDHDATAFAVHAACALLKRAPLVVEMAYYHWRGQAMRAGRFLPRALARVWTLHLHPEEVQRKQEMLDCFTTQQQVVRMFCARVERFRIAPVYDFTVPPHPGALGYEMWGLGMSGETFRSLAHEAVNELRCRV